MINEILKYDKEFNEAMFYSYVSNIFVKLYTSLMFKDLKDIKHFLAPTIYDKYQNIVNDLSKRNVTEMYDELNVSEIKITNVSIENNKIIIIVNLKAKYINYIIDNNGNTISGIDNHRIQKDYRVTLEKQVGAYSQGTVRYCTSCGASIDINKTGICPFCRTTFNQADHDFIVTDII